MTTENQKLHIAIKNMEKDIVDLKNEIRNRDETISEKEKTITDLKRTGIELEKNRFVLEHKIGIIISKYYSISEFMNLQFSIIAKISFSVHF